MSRELKFIYTIKRHNGFVFHSDPFTLQEIQKGAASSFLGKNFALNEKTIFIRQHTSIMDWYEDDIITCRYGEQGKTEKESLSGVVAFAYGSFYITTPVKTLYLHNYNPITNDYLWREGGPIASTKDYFYECTDFVKVGNIYEHKELLQQHEY